jgi:hypothetical protein
MKLDSGPCTIRGTCISEGEYQSELWLSRFRADKPRSNLLAKGNAQRAFDSHVYNNPGIRKFCE